MQLNSYAALKFNCAKEKKILFWLQLAQFEETFTIHIPETGTL